MLFLPSLCGRGAGGEGNSLISNRPYKDKTCPCRRPEFPCSGQEKESEKRKTVEKVMAERAGFEPAIPLRIYRFSRPAPSTTRPPLRVSIAGRPYCIGRVSGYNTHFNTTLQRPGCCRVNAHPSVVGIALFRTGPVQVEAGPGNETILVHQRKRQEAGCGESPGILT